MPQALPLPEPPRAGDAGAEASPLILTLALDPQSQAFFEALRSAYFPPERLVVGAHVTLFHAIPGNLEQKLLSLAADVGKTCPPFRVHVAGVRFLGRGVAFTLRSPDAHRVRAIFAHAFAGSLTRQDGAAWSPHITIQNKVAPEIARKTMVLAAESGFPASVTATGLSAWRYRGGPWQKLDDFVFRGSPQTVL